MTGLQIDQFLAANGAYAGEFDKGSLPLPPGRKVAVVVCMDARIDPAKALGLQEGDAHVIRNAGGLAREALRSLVISQQLLGTREVVVLHHTDCGMLTFTQQQAVDIVRSQIGQDAAHIHFSPFADLDQSVRDDVAFLRAEALIPEDVAVWGGVYEVETGKIRRVE